MQKRKISYYRKILKIHIELMYEAESGHKEIIWILILSLFCMKILFLKYYMLLSYFNIKMDVYKNLLPYWSFLCIIFCPWNSPGNNTCLGSHTFIQGIFCTQGSNSGLLQCRQILFFFFLFFLIFFLFVVNFVIHWNETAMGLHVLPIPIPPPTSLSTRSL